MNGEYSPEGQISVIAVTETVNPHECHNTHSEMTHGYSAFAVSFNKIAKLIINQRQVSGKKIPEKKGGIHWKKVGVVFCIFCIERR